MSTSHHSKTGILLSNLGTPAAPTSQAVRQYLADFLWDPRVIEIPRPLWWLILHGIVLRIRPRRSAALYKKIWTPAGSPLLVNSQKIKIALQHALDSQTGIHESNTQTEYHVALGMRYGNPSIKDALNELRTANVSRIIILPLYPQYSATTTASTFDAVAQVLKNWRAIPELQLIDNYHQHPAYISAIAAAIKNYWQQHGEEDYLLFSFHGLPKRCVTLGDPYQQQCYTTVQLVAAQLQLSAERFMVAFQSRFGAAEWLQPYCDKTLQNLPKQGHKKVAVICPGFAADCLETLEEIAQLNRQLFLDAGGEKFTYIPALNDSAAQILLLNKLIYHS